MSTEDSTATWTLRKNGYGSFTLRRNGEPIIDLGSPKAWAEDLQSRISPSTLCVMGGPDKALRSTRQKNR